MTNKTNRNYRTTSNNYVDHSTFGGLIFYSDFNTNYREDNKKESSIANRIISDWKFDERCRRNIENRDESYMKGNR